jgi:actin-related protein
MTESAQTFIIDHGSDMIKAGFAGDDACKPISNLSYPIVDGIVESWEDMEKVWHHTFKKLRVDPDEAVGVFITEAPGNSKQNREKMTSIMFETFKAKNVYIALSGVMSLYAAGRTTGLACESGHDVTHTIPVFEGFSIPDAVEKMEIAGRVLTEWMQKLLDRQGITLTLSAEMEIVRDMKEKEKFCYVAQNYEHEFAQAFCFTEKDTAYTMPDKRIVKVAGTVRFQCPELLFKPELDGYSCKSLHALTWASVQASDVDLRKDLCKNIILSGGSTMYEGLADRLKNEIENLAPWRAEI